MSMLRHPSIQSRHPSFRNLTTTAFVLVSTVLSLLISGLFTAAAEAAPAAAVLPTSRSVQVGTSATVFATVINADSVDATGCAISLSSAVNADFSYQTTDSATNQLTGTADTPVDIPAGANQSFLLIVTPTSAFDATDVAFDFSCANTGSAPVTSGINTLLLAASTTPVADVIAIALTPSGDGIAQLATDGAFGFFSLATSNVGAAEMITATPAATVALDGAVVICETNPTSGECLATAAADVTTAMTANDTRTYAVFAQSNTEVPLDPAGRRLNVQFTDPSGSVRGSTGVAMRGGGVSASGFFASNNSQQVILANCIECHVNNGLAGATRIIYTPSSMPNFESANFEALANFVALAPGNEDVVLSKAQGGLGHGGGVRLQPGDPNLANLETFLELLVAE